MLTNYMIFYVITFILIFFVIGVILIRNTASKKKSNDGKPIIKVSDIELGLGIKDIDSYRELYTLEEKEDKIFLKIKWVNELYTSTCKQFIIKRYLKPPGSSDTKLISTSIINNSQETFEKYFKESTIPRTYVIGYDDLTTKVSVMGTNYINFEVVLENSTKYTVLDYNSNANPPVIDEDDVNLSMNELGDGITRSFEPVIPTFDIQNEIKRIPYNIQCLRFRTKSVTYNLSGLDNNLNKLFFISHPSIDNAFTLQFQQNDGSFRYIQSTGVITTDVDNSAPLILVNAEKYSNGFLSRIGVINTDRTFKGYLLITEGTDMSNSIIKVDNQLNTRNKLQSSYFIISDIGFFPWCGKLEIFKMADGDLKYTRTTVMSTQITDIKEKLYVNSIESNIGMAKKVYDNDISRIRFYDKNFYIIGKDHTTTTSWNLYVNFKDIIKAFFDKRYLPLEDSKCNSSLQPFTRFNNGNTNTTFGTPDSASFIYVNVFNIDLDFVVGVDWSNDDKTEYEKIIDGINNPLASVEFENYPTHYYRCSGWTYAFPNGSCLNKEGTAIINSSYNTESDGVCEEDCKKNEQCVGYSWKDKNCFQAVLSTKEGLYGVVHSVRRNMSSDFDKSFISKVKKVSGAYLYNVAT